MAGCSIGRVFRFPLTVCASPGPDLVLCPLVSGGDADVCVTQMTREPSSLQSDGGGEGGLGLTGAGRLINLFVGLLLR